MALTASVSRGASTGLTQSPPSSPPPGLQAGITRSSYYTLYRCSAAEEKLETLSSDAPTDAYLTPVSAFLKGTDRVVSLLCGARYSFTHRQSR